MGTVLVFCPQGNLTLKGDLYKRKQGTSNENGGQVIYVIEMAKARAAKGENVHIFARNYDGHEVVTESHPDFPNFSVWPMEFKYGRFIKWCIKRHKPS